MNISRIIGLAAGAAIVTLPGSASATGDWSWWGSGRHSHFKGCGHSSTTSSTTGGSTTSTGGTTSSTTTTSSGATSTSTTSSTTGGITTTTTSTSGGTSSGATSSTTTGGVSSTSSGGGGTPVPEPGMLALFAGGAAGLVFARRLKKRRKPGQDADQAD